MYRYFVSRYPPVLCIGRKPYLWLRLRFPMSPAICWPGMFTADYSTSHSKVIPWNNCLPSRHCFEIITTVRQYCHSSCSPPTFTSTWPHLRCDVGLEEGEYRENCLCHAVLCTIIMVHKGTSSSYRLVDCIGL